MFTGRFRVKLKRQSEANTVKHLSLILFISLICSSVWARMMYASPNIQTYADFKQTYSSLTSVYAIYKQEEYANTPQYACQVERIQAELFTRYPQYASEFNQDSSWVGSFAENAQQWQNLYQDNLPLCQQLKRDEENYRKNSVHTIVN